MGKNILPDTGLLGLNKIAEKYSGFLDKKDLDYIYETWPQVVPVLQGRIEVAAGMEEQFVNILDGLAPATTKQQRAWRLFVIFQQAAHAERLNVRIQNNEIQLHSCQKSIKEKEALLINADNTISSLNEEVLRLKPEVERLKKQAARFESLVTHLFKVNQESLIPSDVLNDSLCVELASLNAASNSIRTLSDEQLKDAHLLLFPGWERTKLIKIHNHMVDQEIEFKYLQVVRNALEAVSPGLKWNPENAFGVHANTDGQ